MDPARAADLVTAHTLLNCLVREVSAPELQTSVSDDHLTVRLPRCDVLLRVAVRRVSMIGAHRFLGPVQRHDGVQWTQIGWRELAGYIRDELELLTGVVNEEFLDQVASSREAIHIAATQRLRLKPSRDPYLDSEQSLIFGHRFHPTPKARIGDARQWLAFGPETGRRFPLRYLAVRPELVAGEGDHRLLDHLHPSPGTDACVLPVHPWQYQMLREHRSVRRALDRGELVDLGTHGPWFTPTASVRTLYTPTLDVFLKFSLNIRITNCVRKNARYELSGAVALNQILQPVFSELALRYPGCELLGEHGYRTLNLQGDPDVVEGFGVIVREGLRPHLLPGVTPLLAAAVADEHHSSTAQVASLLARGNGDLSIWWDAYLGLLMPPVLAAYFHHGVVLEPHLQNVVVGVSADGTPTQMIFRDLEGVKLLPEHHQRALAKMPADVREPLTYDTARGWNRVAYCLLVNHVAEVLAALADVHPGLEPVLWEQVRDHLDAFSRHEGNPPQLRALLAGAPLPAKANLLLRWARQADRHATYVALPHPLGLTRAGQGTL
ncbi:IucA/IucC family protein [Kitasatospora sp. NPDC052896]|uniref:IucA/IucC family protein n=1 Tax=Kitasatospora sp. NPDC052896 TaxID=3364061 RepID=UPI0037C8C7F1